MRLWRFFPNALGLPHLSACYLRQIALQMTTQTLLLSTWSRATLGNPHRIPGQLGTKLSLCMLSRPKRFATILSHSPKVPFRIHVQGVEIFFNAVIDASCTYQKILHSPDGDATAVDIENARAKVGLRNTLLGLYVTFYSVGKMHPRFHSTMIEQFYTALTSLRQGTVHATVEDIGASKIPLVFTELESRVFKCILASQAIPRTEYQLLRRIFSVTYHGGKDSMNAKRKTSRKVLALLRWVLRLLCHKRSSRGSHQTCCAGLVKEK